MLAVIMSTQLDRSDAVARGRRGAHLSGLGAWPWYAAGLACVVVADRIDGWPSLIPLIVGLAFGLVGLTSYGHGRDGLSKYRQ
jgi:hypothetical protein